MPVVPQHANHAQRAQQREPEDPPAVTNAELHTFAAGDDCAGTQQQQQRLELGECNQGACDCQAAWPDQDQLPEQLQPAGSHPSWGPNQCWGADRKQRQGREQRDMRQSLTVLPKQQSSDMYHVQNQVFPNSDAPAQSAQASSEASSMLSDSNPVSQHAQHNTLPRHLQHENDLVNLQQVPQSQHAQHVTRPPQSQQAQHAQQAQLDHQAQRAQLAPYAQQAQLAHQAQHAQQSLSICEPQQAQRRQHAQRSMQAGFKATVSMSARLRQHSTESWSSNSNSTSSSIVNQCSATIHSPEATGHMSIHATLSPKKQSQSARHSRQMQPASYSNAATGQQDLNCISKQLQLQDKLPGQRSSSSSSSAWQQAESCTMTPVPCSAAPVHATTSAGLHQGALPRAVQPLQAAEVDRLEQGAPPQAIQPLEAAVVQGLHQDVLPQALQPLQVVEAQGLHPPDLCIASLAAVTRASSIVNAQRAMSRSASTVINKAAPSHRQTMSLSGSSAQPMILASSLAAPQVNSVSTQLPRSQSVSSTGRPSSACQASHADAGDAQGQHGPAPQAALRRSSGPQALPAQHANQMVDADDHAGGGEQEAGAEANLACTLQQQVQRVVSGISAETQELSSHLRAEAGVVPQPKPRQQRQCQLVQEQDSKALPQLQAVPHSHEASRARPSAKQANSGSQRPGLSPSASAGSADSSREPDHTKGGSLRPGSVHEGSSRTQQSPQSADGTAQQQLQRVASSDSSSQRPVLQFKRGAQHSMAQPKSTAQQAGVQPGYGSSQAVSQLKHTAEQTVLQAHCDPQPTEPQAVLQPGCLTQQAECDYSPCHLTQQSVLASGHNAQQAVLNADCSSPHAARQASLQPHPLPELDYSSELDCSSERMTPQALQQPQLSEQQALSELDYSPKHESPQVSLQHQYSAQHRTSPAEGLALLQEQSQLALAAQGSCSELSREGLEEDNCRLRQALAAIEQQLGMLQNQQVRCVSADSMHTGVSIALCVTSPVYHKVSI